jgi:hypothetical protein
MDSTMTRLPAITSSEPDEGKRNVAKLWAMILLGSTAFMWALSVALATGLIALRG